ncbi:hypothetical protein LUX29_09630 [Aureimonas altamirensis]|uniref:hypothetical protein n=1 Tax=Aureimonas altamirensis TaxID=370622 RepID=UPI001E371ACC|nr:hypothetical protein [Aureimonas altamirensis]UHD47403.1 hypothetical protein LUX29_09630 [Aureimonas altamirensis]
MKNKAKVAAKFAIGRALAVMYGALVGIGFWAIILMVGPVVEARYYPVIRDFTIHDVIRTRVGVLFTPHFYKQRTAFYQGSSWEIVNEDGSNVRVQAQLPVVFTAPETGPVGPRIGRQIFLPLPEGRQCFIGTYYHDTGFFWQAATRFGPFCVDGAEGIGPPY